MLVPSLVLELAPVAHNFHLRAHFSPVKYDGILAFKFESAAELAVGSESSELALGPHVLIKLIIGEHGLAQVTLKLL